MYFWINVLLWSLGTLLIGLFFALALEPRWERIPRWVYPVAFMIFAFPTVMMKISNPEMPILYVLAVLVSILYVFAAFRDRLWKKALALVLFIAGSEVCEIPVSYFMDSLNIPYDTTFNSIHMVMVDSMETAFLLIVLALLLLAWTRVFKRQSLIHHSYIFFIFPISQITMLFAFDGFTAETRYLSNIYVSIGAILGLIADFILLYVLMEQGKKEALKRELQELETLHRLEEVHYQAIEARREEIARIRHDFNNQLVAAYNLIRTGEEKRAAELLDELKTTISGTTEYTYCANAVVNAVLTEKAVECKQSDVDLKTEIKLTDEPSIQSVHLCSIFSNLCDNAIKAANKCPKEQRFISIRAARKGDYLHVRVENSSPNPDGKKRTDRKAYGQEILKDIASRYNGQFACGWDNGVYSAMLSLTISV